MDILTAEMLEKLVSPKDITTFVVIWFFIKSRVNGHFVSIESSLESIGKHINALKESLVRLESTHDQRIIDLSERVDRLEEA